MAYKYVFAVDIRLTVFGPLACFKPHLRLSLLLLDYQTFLSGIKDIFAVHILPFASLDGLDAWWLNGWSAEHGFPDNLELY